MRPPAPTQPNQAASEAFITERKRIVDQISGWAGRLNQKEADSIIYDIRQLISILREWDDLSGDETGNCFHQKVQKIMDSLEFVWHQVDKWLEADWLKGRGLEANTRDFPVGSFYYISQVFNIVGWQIGRLTLQGYDYSDTYAVETARRLEETEWGYVTWGRCRGPAMTLTEENDPNGDIAKLLVFWNHIHIDLISGCACLQCLGV